ncbi:MAG: DUF350 domain-containing protein [Deltaproteobacteria bacterium]|nr:DUF350 domain-containing protein [Deltaproteobacteria bacterium]
MQWDGILQNLLSAAIFTALGMVLFVISFFVFDKITPYSLWKELIEEHNTALAIVIGSISLGMCLIIAMAVH